MKLNARFCLGLCLLLAGVLCLGADALAQSAATAPGSSNGSTSQMLATGLYCDVRGLISGNVGLILGLFLVFSGLWSIVMGGGIASAVLTIIIGATVPSIPGLVEGFMQGLGALIAQSGMSSNGRTFTPPTCQASSSGTQLPPVQPLDLEPGTQCSGGYLDCL